MAPRAASAAALAVLGALKSRERVLVDLVVYSYTAFSGASISISNYSDVDIRVLSPGHARGSGAH